MTSSRMYSIIDDWEAQTAPPGGSWDESDFSDFVPTYYPTYQMDAVMPGELADVSKPRNLGTGVTFHATMVDDFDALPYCPDCEQPLHRCRCISINMRLAAKLEAAMRDLEQLDMFAALEAAGMSDIPIDQPEPEPEPEEPPARAEPWGRHAPIDRRPFRIIYLANDESTHRLGDIQYHCSEIEARTTGLNLVRRTFPDAVLVEVAPCDDPRKATSTDYTVLTGERIRLWKGMVLVTESMQLISAMQMVQQGRAYVVNSGEIRQR